MALTAVDKSAQTLIDQTLSSYGLGALGSWAWYRYKHGVPINQIMLEMRDRPEYKARFPGMEALRKQGRAISEQAYVDYERTAASLFRQAGLPKGFYDRPDDFGKLIASEVSPSELSDRLKMVTAAAYATPPDVRAELKRLYGVGEGDIAAYFLNPDRAMPILQERFTAAQTAGTAQRTGYGDLSRREAENLAQLGVTPDQQQQGFGQLVQAQELFRPLDSGEDAITRQEQMGSVFGGNAASNARIRRRAARRQAEYQGGGGYAQSQQGRTGLGSAST